MEIVWGYPEVIMISMYMISILKDLGNIDNKDSFYNFSTTLIGSMFMLGMLYWGGFFS